MFEIHEKSRSYATPLWGNDIQNLILSGKANYWLTRFFIQKILRWNSKKGTKEGEKGKGKKGRGGRGGVAGVDLGGGCRGCVPSPLR